MIVSAKIKHVARAVMKSALSLAPAARCSRARTNNDVGYAIPPTSKYSAILLVTTPWLVIINWTKTIIMLGVLVITFIALLESQ